MSGLELLIAVAGFTVTVLVVAAMILITPRGQVELHARVTDPQDAILSPAPAAERPEPAGAQRPTPRSVSTARSRLPRR